MRFESLLDAMEEYVKARKRLESASYAPCSDWDCGISSEFDAAFMAEGPRQELEEAKAALETALNLYIEARVAALITKHNSGAR